MKKALIYFYHYQTKFTEIIGHEHNSEIEYDKLFETAQDIFNKGLNVMIVNLPKGTDNDSDIKAILYVDDRTFKQR